MAVKHSSRVAPPPPEDRPWAQHTHCGMHHLHMHAALGLGWPMETNNRIQRASFSRTAFPNEQTKPWTTLQIWCPSLLVGPEENAKRPTR